jgi:hypothetical protein
LLLARHWSVAQPDNNSRRPFKIIAIATASVWAACAIVLPPLVARAFPSYALFAQSRAYLQPQMEFASLDYAEPSLVWYFRSRVKGFLTPLRKNNAAKFMAEPRPRFVIIPTDFAADASIQVDNNWKTFSTHGFNIPKGKRVDLTLLLKPE